MPELTNILTDSIHYARREIKDCRSELAGGRETNDLHHNLLGHIAGTYEDEARYSDSACPSFQELTKRALEFQEDSARFYDSLCRRELDVDDMQQFLGRDFDPKSPLGGADVIMYLLGKYALTDLKKGSAIALKLEDLYLDSDHRKAQIQGEIKLFEDYLSLCQEKLKSELNSIDIDLNYHPSLEKFIQYSKDTAAKALAHCQEELQGIREIYNLHRNIFHWIGGSYAATAIYFDASDPLHVNVRERADDIEQARNAQYDKVARKYLDIEDMIDVFQKCIDEKEGEDFCISSNLQGVRLGKTFRGAEICNYVLRAEKGKYTREQIFESIDNIDAETMRSETRTCSVRQEMKVYEDYLALCAEMLSAFAATRPDAETLIK